MIGAALLTAGDRPSRADDKTLELRNAGGMTGLTFYDRGEWAVVRSVVANHTDREQTADLTLFFKQGPGTYFGSRVWLPPRSVKEVTTLVSTTPLPARFDKRGAETRISLSQGARACSPSAAATTLPARSTARWSRPPAPAPRRFPSPPTPPRQTTPPGPGSTCSPLSRPPTA